MEGKKKTLQYSWSSLWLFFLTVSQKRKRSAGIFLCDDNYYTDIPRVNHVCCSLSNVPTEQGGAERLKGRSVFCALSFQCKLLISAVRWKYLYEVFSQLHLKFFCDLFFCLFFFKERKHCFCTRASLNLRDQFQCAWPLVLLVQLFRKY